MTRELVGLLGSGLLATGLVGATVVGLPASESPPGRPVTSVATSDLSGGRMLFLTKGCNGCHSLGEVQPAIAIGPDLTRLVSVAATRRPSVSAEAYVRESIVDPQAYVVAGFGENEVERMPKLPLSPAELDALVAYLLARPAS